MQSSITEKIVEQERSQEDEEEETESDDDKSFWRASHNRIENEAAEKFRTPVLYDRRTY